MSQIQQMIAEVRVYLDEPNHAHPTERHLWTLMTHCLQSFSNELQNTGQNWNIGSWQLDVAPGTEEYLITAMDFGKPIYVLTKSFDPSVAEREVPIVDIQNFDFPTPGRYSGLMNEAHHSASGIGFYGKFAGSQAHYCRVNPKPQASAAYTVWYKPGPLPTMGLGSEMLLPEHHQLLVTRTAIAAIPYCQWPQLNNQPDLAMAKAKALQQSIGFMNSMHEEAFQRYKNNLRQETMSTRVLFGEFADW